MNRPVTPDHDAAPRDWRRISSFKPYVAGAVSTFAAALCALVLWHGTPEIVAIVIGVASVAFGLIALTCKVVHRRGPEYQVSSAFFSERIAAHDICMVVTKPGPLWTSIRIHLRRPIRFGWVVSFVPAQADFTPARSPENQHAH